MSNMKSYLTIKGFPREGQTFKTKVIDWAFGNGPTNAASADLRKNPKPLAQALNPLFIARKQDEFSSLFMISSSSQNPGNTRRFPEASLTVDTYGRNGNLKSRMIYDFFDFGVSGYYNDSKMEQIFFDFARASSFYSAVETITMP